MRQGRGDRSAHAGARGGAACVVCMQLLVAIAIGWGTTAVPAVRWLIGAGVVAVWLAYFAYAERVFRRSPAAAAAREPARTA